MSKTAREYPTLPLGGDPSLCSLPRELPDSVPGPTLTITLTPRTTPAGFSWLKRTRPFPWSFLQLLSCSWAPQKGRWVGSKAPAPQRPPATGHTGGTAAEGGPGSPGSGSEAESATDGGEMLSAGWAPVGDACEGRGLGPCEMHSIPRAKTRGGGVWQKGPRIHQPCRADGRSRGVERNNQCAGRRGRTQPFRVLNAG